MMIKKNKDEYGNLPVRLLGADREVFNAGLPLHITPQAAAVKKRVAHTFGSL
jgi:hypothetical protein